VLTTFADQIARGGPVTVTHPEVTRYFMTIPEAVQLVLQAAAFGDNGDALLLEMGTPVKIVEVAQQLISLSNRKVDIEFTGLRPGEKMHEDLTSASENSLTTEHHLIQRVSVEPLVESLEIISTSDVSVDHVSLMREMVMKS
jgi:FlaA1/EpsC-like NDP-sugar epimerase